MSLGLVYGIGTLCFAWLDASPRRRIIIFVSTVAVGLVLFYLRMNYGEMFQEFRHGTR